MIMWYNIQTVVIRLLPMEIKMSKYKITKSSYADGGTINGLLWFRDERGLFVDDEPASGAMLAALLARGY